MALRQFDSYSIVYYGGKDTYLHSRIGLLSGGTAVGRLNFITDGNSIPESKDLNGLFIINFHESRFSEVVDILRNEKPLYLDLASHLGIGVLQTTKEPIGEGEEL